MKVGHKYRTIKEYSALSDNYNHEYFIDIGTIIEVVEIRSTSYGVSCDRQFDPAIILRIPKGILLDETYFKPFFRDKNLNDLLDVNNK